MDIFIKLSTNSKMDKVCSSPVLISEKKLEKSFTSHCTKPYINPTVNLINKNHSLEMNHYVQVLLLIDEINICVTRENSFNRAMSLNPCIYPNL